MSNFLPSEREMAFGDIDDESQAETNSLNHSIDHRENEKRHKPKWNIPTRRQRLWRILKCIAFVVIAALALVAFCLSLHGGYNLFCDRFHR